VDVAAELRRSGADHPLRVRLHVVGRELARAEPAVRVMDDPERVEAHLQRLHRQPGAILDRSPEASSLEIRGARLVREAVQARGDGLREHVEVGLAWRVGGLEVPEQIVGQRGLVGGDERRTNLHPSPRQADEDRTGVPLDDARVVDAHRLHECQEACSGHARYLGEVNAKLHRGAPGHPQVAPVLPRAARRPTSSSTVEAYRISGKRELQAGSPGPFAAAIPSAAPFVARCRLAAPPTGKGSLSPRDGGLRMDLVAPDAGCAPRGGTAEGSATPSGPVTVCCMP